MPAERDIKRVQDALRGIEPYEGPDFRRVRFESGITVPSSYMVRIALCGIGQIPCWRGDKAVWETLITFEGTCFEVRDRKGGAWTIEVDSDSDEAIEKARQLKRKITAACAILDKVLQKDLEEQVARGNFYLNNSYPKVRSLYDAFREKVEDAKSMTTSDPDHDIRDFLSFWFRQNAEIASNTAAMITMFYSYLEFIFDVIFAFQHNKEESIIDFRQKAWANRFKTLFDLSSDPELKKLYDELLRIKRVYRDTILHGYGGKDGFLVSIPLVGLVPTSSELLSTSAQYILLPIEREECDRILETFDKFGVWLANDPNTQFAIIFAETGLPIPMQEDELEKYRAEMTSSDTFREYLYAELEYQQYLIDQYQ